MKYCRLCKEPVIFVPLIGWSHMTFEEFDHDVRL